MGQREVEDIEDALANTLRFFAEGSLSLLHALATIEERNAGWPFRRLLISQVTNSENGPNTALAVSLASGAYRTQTVQANDCGLGSSTVPA